MTNEEALLIDIKFQLDMYGSGQGSAEDTLTRVREIIFSPSLTDDQQVVLEWLKNRRIDYKERLSTIIYFLTVHYPYGTDEHLSIKRIFRKLSKQEEAQVLQAFATWALEQEEDK